MKKTIFIFLFVLFAGVLFQSCGPNDQKLQNDVNSRISNTYPDVRVSVNNGVATLTGTVNTDAQRNAAAESVRSVNNVKSVVNNIRVNQMQQNNNAVAVNSDNTINNTIRAGLYAAGYNDINVEVRNGEVYLTGDVNRRDLENVMQIANESSPRRVVNELNIK